MYCYQGKEHFCSILFTSQKPENGKTTLVECLLGDPENSELMLFYCFLSFLKKKKEQMWISEGLEGKKETAQVTGPSSLGLTLSSGELALSFLYFQRGSTRPPDWHQPVRGTQVHPFRVFTNETASPNSQSLPLVSILLVCALLAVKARTERASVWV